jgi:hypothetical protein
LFGLRSDMTLEGLLAMHRNAGSPLADYVLGAHPNADTGVSCRTASEGLGDFSRETPLT